MLSPLSGTLTSLSRRRKVSAAPFGPGDIPGLQLWLEADAIAGVADGDPVATWPDRSGHGRDATQGTAGARPIWRAAATGGLPAVAFDGSNDQLNIAGVSLPQPFTYFLLLSSAPSSGSSGVYIWDGDPFDQAGLTAYSSGFRAYGGGSLFQSLRQFSTPSIVCLVANGSGSSLELYDTVNGTAAPVTGDIGTASFTSPWHLGGIGIGGYYSDAAVAAVLLADSALAAGVRANTFNYLKSKYGI